MQKRLSHRSERSIQPGLFRCAAHGLRIGRLYAHCALGPFLLVLGLTLAACGSGPTENGNGGGGGGGGDASGLVIWTQTPELVPIAVSFDGVAAGSITQSFAAPPACGAAGAVTVTTARSYTLTAQGGRGTWNAPVEVPTTGCQTFELRADITTLTITGEGVGSGTVKSLSGRVNCAVTDGRATATGCVAKAIVGTHFELLVTPEATSVFDAWSGACTGSAQPCIAQAVAGGATLGVRLSPAAETPGYVTVRGGGSGRVFSDDGRINCTITSSFSGAACEKLLDATGSLTLRYELGPGMGSFGGWAGSCRSATARA